MTLLLLYETPPSPPPSAPPSIRFRFIPIPGNCEPSWELCIAWRGARAPNPGPIPGIPNILKGSVNMLLIMWFCIWRIEFIVWLKKKFRKNKINKKWRNTKKFLETSRKIFRFDFSRCFSYPKIGSSSRSPKKKFCRDILAFNFVLANQILVIYLLKIFYLTSDWG